MQNHQWHKDSIATFYVDIADTLSKNNVFIQLRNNKDYGFNNLFLIVEVNFPNETKIIDTLEYEMTDAKGYFLGEGITDIKENKLEYKTNIQFPVKGKYAFSVQHAMRKLAEEKGLENLKGVTDIGIQIEKMN
jgi:gliding motility-associated lipoprotein GldH